MKRNVLIVFHSLWFLSLKTKQMFIIQFCSCFSIYFDCLCKGVNAGPNERMNPLKSILKEFNEDDLIIFKLDIDTGSIEVPLAQQLLQDESIRGLVDHFYFEHHVNIKEMESWWGGSMEGTIKESLDLMSGLRQIGVGSHFWI